MAVDAVLLVVAEAVVEDVGLEGVVNGIERLDERPEPVEVGLEGGGVGFQVHLVLGGEPGEVGVAEGDLVPQAGVLAQQLVHLRQGQALVDFEAAETAAVTVLQVGEDQVHESRVIRPLEARQQVAALVVGDRLAGRQLQPGVFDSLEVASAPRPGPA